MDTLIRCLRVMDGFVLSNVEVGPRFALRCEGHCWWWWSHRFNCSFRKEWVLILKRLGRYWRSSLQLRSRFPRIPTPMKSAWFTMCWGLFFVVLYLKKSCLVPLFFLLVYFHQWEDVLSLLLLHDDLLLELQWEEILSPIVSSPWPKPWCCWQWMDPFL